MKKLSEEQRLKRNENSKRFYHKHKKEQREYHYLKTIEWRKKNPDRYRELQRGYMKKKSMKKKPEDKKHDIEYILVSYKIGILSLEETSWIIRHNLTK